MSRGLSAGRRLTPACLVAIVAGLKGKERPANFSPPLQLEYGVSVAYHRV